MVGGLFVLSMITYIDRAAISSAINSIRAEMRFGEREAGWVFSAFAFGYALAQVPAGMLADRLGARRALALVVVVWSGFTAMTGAVHSLGVLLAVRALFGIAEAGAFPGSARAIANWLTPGQRGLANGILFSGSRVGAALAFPLLAGLMAQFGWRGAFGVLGLAGALWAAAWWWFYRDPAANLATPAPVRGSFRFSPQLGLAMVQYFAENFTFFICMSWMLPWLQQRFSLSPMEAARYAMIPLLAGASAQWAAGLLVDRLYGMRRWRPWSRRLPAMTGFALAAAGLIATAQAPSPGAAVFWLAVTTFAADLTIAPSWAYCADIGGPHTAALSGAMNMVGNFGSVLSGLAFPVLSQWTGSSSSYFYTAAALNVAAVCCWWRMISPEPPTAAGD